MTDGEAKNTSDRRLVLWTVVILVVAGLGAFLFFAATERSFSRCFGAGVLLASGAFTTGSLLGLLFGIPRTPQSASEAPDSKFLATNNNLIQVSDWLTKVLLGAGLTQVTKVPHGLVAFGEYYGKEVGGSTLAVFLLVHFFFSGFLSGYLVTRVFLQHAFHRADRRPDDAKDESLLEAAPMEEKDPSPPPTEKGQPATEVGNDIPSIEEGPA